MLSLLYVIFRYKKTVVLVTVAALAVSSIVSLLLPQRFEASTIFMPLGVQREITGMRGFFAQFGRFGESFGVFLRARKNLIINMFIRSRRMSDLISERFGFEEIYGVSGGKEVRKRLEKKTGVLVRDEGVIVLSFEDGDPSRALAVVEAYLGNLDSLLVGMNAESAEEKVYFLGEEVARRERLAASADSALRDFQVEHGIYEIENQARAALRIASALGARMSMLDVERRLLEMTMKAGSPELERLERELEKVNEQIAFMSEGGGTGGELFPPLREMPGLDARYVQLYTEIMRQGFVLTYLKLKLEDARIMANRNTSVIRVLDPPVMPERRSWPKRKIIVLVSTASAFFWACLVLMVRERWGEWIAEAKTSLRGEEAPGDGNGTDPGGCYGRREETGEA